MTPPAETPPDPPLASSSGDDPGMERLKQVLPQLEFQAQIGRGGMGVVYRARHRSLNRIVAVKVLGSELHRADATFAERFKKEAQAMARLSHPGIVAAHDSGETADGQLYFVMEHVEGQDLAQVLRTRTKLPPAEALAIALEVCDALGYAHEHGVVHRDIKPSNILITAQGRVKVADFGLAKMEGEMATGALTKTDTAIGTPEYVSPEAMILGTHVDKRADLYALGVMLYQMLTGEIPRGLFLMPGVQSRGAIDARFDRVISKAMQSERDKRYPAAAEMRADLEAIRAGAAAPADTRKSVAAANESRSRGSRRMIVVMAALCVAAGMAAFMWMKDGSDQTPAGSAPTPAPVPELHLRPEMWRDGLDEWWRGARESSANLLTRENGGARVNERKGVFMRSAMPDVLFRDVVFRAKVRDTTELTSLYFRMSGAYESLKNYQAVFWHTGESKLALNGTQPGNKELARFSAPKGFVPGASHTFEVQVRGEEFTIFIDGKRIGAARDGTLREGKIYFMGDPGTLIEKLEYAEF